MEQPSFLHTLRLTDQPLNGQTIIAAAATVVDKNAKALREKGPIVELRFLQRYRNGEEFVVAQVGVNSDTSIRNDMNTVYVRPVLDNPHEGFNPDRTYQYVHLVGGLSVSDVGRSVRYSVTSMAIRTIRQFAADLSQQLGLPPLAEVEELCVRCRAKIQRDTPDGMPRCSQHGLEPPLWLAPLQYE